MQQASQKVFCMSFKKVEKVCRKCRFFYRCRSSFFFQDYQLDQVIAMDNFSCFPDKRNDFASFLTVSRKFKYSCVYIFHIIYPEKSIWNLILLQIKKINIFVGSVEHPSILKILSENCVAETISFLPLNFLWINRLFVNLEKRNEKICLTLDC